MEKLLDLNEQATVEVEQATSWNFYFEGERYFDGTRAFLTAGVSRSPCSTPTVRSPGPGRTASTPSPTPRSASTRTTATRTPSGETLGSPQVPTDAQLAAITARQGLEELGLAPAAGRLPARARASPTVWRAGGSLSLDERG
ncbi:hypothetical protein [Georgenia alba]|uniref:Uncharacterized protein n=1 Tax=Georgenia alba TaxID=2233858 RepID=A0ABW2Q3W2_9MICO